PAAGRLPQKAAIRRWPGWGVEGVTAPADAERMIREAIARGRCALDPGADPYEHVELGAATRVGGAMVLVAFAFAAISLLVSPPSGPLGWWGVAGFMALALGVGTHLVRKAEPSRPDALLAGVLVSLLAAGAYRASAGANAPFEQLLFIVAIYACTIHTVRRSLLVLAIASATACSPAGTARARRLRRPHRQPAAADLVHGADHLGLDDAGPPPARRGEGQL
ncbi:MAG: hypothetical protein ACR2NB_14630, partial [Solirubrobacteraceae bacterium]